MPKIHRNALQPGYVLHWYEILGILGQGGFGITYLALDRNLNQRVAIKEYLPIEFAVRERDCSVHPVSEDKGGGFSWGLDRFLEEARTLAQFRHPNIVRVQAVFEENNTAYMVMEFEEGDSMGTCLKERRTLEEAELLKILLPILGGPEQVHRAGFIHRDIKPDNIFIRHDGSPVLLDFGSARQALGVQTRTLTGLVSPGYAPFEQYVGESDQQGPWTDIYGLGATLYRAVAGVAPQDAMDRSHALRQTNQEVFVPITDIGKGRYSNRFLEAVSAALHFKPTERPQTLADWRAMFEGELAPTEARNSPLDPGVSETTILATDSGANQWQNARGGRVPVQRRVRPQYLLIILLITTLAAPVCWWYWQPDRLVVKKPEVVLSGQAPHSRDDPMTRRIDELLAQAEAAFDAGRLTGEGAIPRWRGSEQCCYWMQKVIRRKPAWQR